MSDFSQIIAPAPPIDKRFILQAKEMFERGTSIDDIIVYLHECKVNIVDVMSILSHAKIVDSRTAKQLVWKHPVWSLDIDTIDNVHQDALSALDEETKE